MFFGKEVRVFLKDDARESYLKLRMRSDGQSKSILRSIERIKGILKENPQVGEPISKDMIPKKFMKMGIKNMYRLELSNYWRMLYTIEGDRVEIFVFILSIDSHKDYNKLFGYK